MRFYKHFYKNVNGAQPLIDPITYTVDVVAVAGPTLVESPTPVKTTAEYPDGQWYIDITDALYTAPAVYEIQGTFELVSGNTQTYAERFIPKAAAATGASIIFGQSCPFPTGRSI